MPNSISKKPEFRREHRLGLVVYGGVSLAIYMNGVCREFYNAVRGRGIYKLVKALTDSDIVVDIVSGTSAGGINGVLLSYALTNSSENEVVEFADFAQIWRESGDIQKLMYDPNPNEFTATTRESILDGEGYYQTQLSKAFEKAQENQRINQVPPDEWYSASNELDLFVTGTDVLGRVSKAFDDTECVIELKDHRAMFQLKYRQDRNEPFNPQFKSGDSASPKNDAKVTYDALAKLCRITSCFPVAFPVVEVKLKSQDKVDQKLVEWGRLNLRELPQNLAAESYKLYFVDGGVLDNRPFSYTIKEMYYRTANRPVDRKLFYIDPSPDRFEGSPKYQEMLKPDILEIIQDSLIGLPTYESITNDLEAIKTHNEKVSRYKSLLANIDISERFKDKSLLNDEGIYLWSRIVSLRDRVLPLVLRMEQGNTTVSGKTKQDILEKTAKLLTQRLTQEDEEERKEILIKAGNQIRNLDIEYALRKHFYFIQSICQLLEDKSESLEKQGNFNEYTKLQLLIGKFTRQVKLLEVIRDTLDQLLNHLPVSEHFYSLINQSHPANALDERNNEIRQRFYEHLLRLHRFLLDSKGLKLWLSSDLPNKPNLDRIQPTFFEELPQQARKSQELSLQAKQLRGEAEIPELDAEVKKWLTQPEISRVRKTLQDKIQAITQSEHLELIWNEERFSDNNEQNDSTLFSSILCQVEDASEALIKASGLDKNSHAWKFFDKKLGRSDNFNSSDDGNPILSYFKNFYQLDQVLYPFEYLTDIKEKEIIRTIRISPNDAQLGFGKGKTIDNKLAGDTLRAFGGFFKKSWRSNDIMWGRLDGLNRIVEALVTRESLENFSRFLNRELKDKLPEERWNYLIDECFPNVQLSDRDKFKAHLSKLAQPKTLTDSQLKQILDDLVLEAQREILKEEVPHIIEDGISEQINWNQQRVLPNNTKNSDPTPIYQPVIGYFDKALTSLAAAQLAKESINQIQAEDVFRQQYNIGLEVGSEKLLKDIPTKILVTLATRFTLVLRDVFVPLLGNRRSERLRRSLTYQVFNNALQFFYGLLQVDWIIIRQNPNRFWKKIVILGLQVVFFAIAVVGVAVTVSNSLWWVAIALICALLSWLLGAPWKQPKSVKTSDNILTKEE